MTAPHADPVEALIPVLCPHLDRRSHDARRECHRCPARVETRHGPGVQACRHLAADVAHEVVQALRDVGYEVVPADAIADARRSPVPVGLWAHVALVEGAARSTRRSSPATEGQ